MTERDPISKKKKKKKLQRKEGNGLVTGVCTKLKKKKKKYAVNP